MEWELGRERRRRSRGWWEDLAPDARDDFREIALQQKGILIAILAHLLLLVALLFFSESWRVFVATVYVFIAMAGSGATLLFALSRHGAIKAIVLAIATIVPLFGATVLVWAHTKASTELKQYGGPVGWLGVPWRHIPPG